MPQAEDRRVRRTRRNLAEALIGLILHKGYERITVQDILDRADVGRSTFYAHFRDKEALLLSCFDGLREDLNQHLDANLPGTGPAGPREQIPSVIFAHAYRHRPVYRALCGRQGGHIVYGHLHALLTHALSPGVAPDLAPDLASVPAQVPAAVAAEFYASALLGLLTWWVSQDFPNGPDWMAQMYDALASPRLGAAAVAP
jgi:AcrR family transcriptional regulator